MTLFTNVVEAQELNAEELQACAGGWCGTPYPVNTGGGDDQIGPIELDCGPQGFEGPGIKASDFVDSGDAVFDPLAYVR